MNAWSRYAVWMVPVFLIVIDEIRLLLMNILVKFQPDIPILMVMRQINPLRPQIWGTSEKQLKRGKNYDTQLQTPQTLKLSWSTHNVLVDVQLSIQYLKKKHNENFMV
jgi:hypothetical protein